MIAVSQNSQLFPIRAFFIEARPPTSEQLILAAALTPSAVWLITLVLHSHTFTAYKQLQLSSCIKLVEKVKGRWSDS
jgi:hypothetical protein